MRLKSLILLFTVLVKPVCGQDPDGEVGLPLISNYSPTTYNAHSQNWSILQDHRGIMYFGNGDGVLEFDGISWRFIQLPKATIVRSLAKGRSGNIYIGSENEFGYLAVDHEQRAAYVSLSKTLTPGVRDFGDVWCTVVADNYVYFSTDKYLFRIVDPIGHDFDSNDVRTWRTNTRFHMAFGVQKQVFVRQVDIGLMTIDMDSLILVPGGEFYRDRAVYAMMPFRKKILIATRSSGIYVYDGKESILLRTGADALIKDSRVYHGTALPGDMFALATLQSGVIVINGHGDLVAVWNNDSGLQNNTVWTSYVDKNGSLWLGLNSGISKVETPLSLTRFDERSGLEGSVSSITRHNQNIYVSTNLGIYMLLPSSHKRAKPMFTRIQGVNTQAWHLLSAGSHLLASANDGVYEITGRAAKKITGHGPWSLSRSRIDTNLIYVIGEGLGLLRYRDLRWFYQGKVAGIKEDVFDGVETDKALWLGSKYQGILRIRLPADHYMKPEIERYDTSSGLPSMAYNFVFPFGAEVTFGTADGIYRYDETSRRFVPDGRFDAVLKEGAQSIVHLAGEDLGTIWLGSVTKTGRAVRTDRGAHYRWIEEPFQRIAGTRIYAVFSEPGSSTVLWYGGPDGLIRYDRAANKSYRPLFPVRIRSVSVRDSTLFMDNTIEHTAGAHVDYENNNFRFTVSLPDYDLTVANMYSYKLEGFDRDWSEWTTESKKDYTNIPEGAYDFRVKAKNVYGHESDQAAYSFVVLPPWYRTWWAFSGYAAAFFAFGFVLIRTLVSKAQKKAVKDRMKIETVRKEAEEKLRKQVAADFHDELGNRITKISLFSEILRNQMAKEKNTIDYLDKINENAQSLYNETRDFIWQLDPSKDSVYDLAARMKKFGEELYEGTGILFEMEPVSQDLEHIKLPMDYLRNTIRVIKEAMHNTLKHSHAATVKLLIQVESGVLKLQVIDDGRGFDTAICKDGQGLQNMRVRARAIGAEFEIVSNNYGTKLCLNSDLPKRVG